VAANEQPLPTFPTRSAAHGASQPAHPTALASRARVAATQAQSAVGWRLRKHADYQRVYQASRKHFSSSMSYFYALRPAALAGKVAPPIPSSTSGPRVGLTVGKVLGNAVARNRIKRRMREAVRIHVATLTADVDVILHPRNFVATVDFAKLEAEVGRIFATVQSTLDRQREKP
jgi:ribonuclease P protein component